MKLLPLAATALTLAAAPAAAATFVNAGFESGDLSGWTAAGGAVDVLTAADDFWQTPPLGEHFVATEGVDFARLTPGATPDVYTTLSQAFTLSAQSTLTFDAAFLAFDSLPFDDDAYVRIFDQTSNLVVFQSSVGAVGDFGHTGWQSFEASLGAGSYTFEAGVRDAQDPDSEFSSRLLLDNVSATAGAVPEPQAWSLMILGFFGMGGLLRTRRTGAALAR